jgi:guanylate kinase
MVLLIAGRSGSGKDHITRLLEKQGLSVVKSYATRPKRQENEDTHIFITKEEAAAIPDEDKVAKTIINDNEYFATREQVMNSDIYIIDPNGIDVLVKNMPEEVFHLIYVEADTLNRRIHAVKRAKDKIKEEEIFNQRDIAEDEQFSEFEEKLESLTDKPLADNITLVYNFENDYDPEEAKKFVKTVLAVRKLHNKVTEIVKNAAELGMLEKSPDDNSLLAATTADDKVRYVTQEHFADLLTSNTQVFGKFMQDYLIQNE